LRPALLAAVLAATSACVHAPADAEPAADPLPADTACLAWLDEHHVSYGAAPDLLEVRTPIEVRGPLGNVRLVPRAGRAPQMDCALAQALCEAGPLFDELGVGALSSSGAYDRRLRRDSSRLSEHAHGLAIDVHGLDGEAGPLEVARDFEAGVGRWRDLVPGEGALEACIGQPRTTKGRALRTLACRLKLHSAFRVIITPDDDADHRDHLHLEAFGDPLARVRRIVGVLPLRATAR
jgi:hypothetical protein